MTIKELKEFIKNLPEKDRFNEDYEVYIEHTDDENYSSILVEIFPLNEGDILLSIKQKT